MKDETIKVIHRTMKERVEYLERMLASSGHMNWTPENMTRVGAMIQDMKDALEASKRALADFEAEHVHG